VALSQYLDGALTPRRRVAVEAHLGECADCRRLLRSLSSTMGALASMGEHSPSRRAESIIAAIRSESPSADSTAPRAAGGRSRLTMLPGGVERSANPPREHRRAGIPRAVLRYCLRRPQLRLTMPIALAVGIALSLINQGGMLLAGQIDVEMCAVCGLNFLIPFLALNVVLVATGRIWIGRRR
jgi:anti-sigma factor RsiW